MQRLAKYLIRTKDYRLVFGTDDPLGHELPYGYTDSDWGADLDFRRSTGSYIFFLDGASVSWKVKLSPTICLSTQEAEYYAYYEAEYYALSEGTKEALNLRPPSLLPPSSSLLPPPSSLLRVPPQRLQNISIH